MKTFSIRIDDDLFNKVEAAREDKPRTDFIREVIEGYFVTKSSPEFNQASPELNQASPSLNLPSPEQVKHTESLKSEIVLLQAKNESLEKLIQAKDKTIRILEEDKGFVTLEYTQAKSKLDNLLMPSSEEIQKKSWWQFWK